MSRQGAEGEGHETDVRVKTARWHVLPRRKGPRTEGAHLLSSLCSLLSSIGSEWRVRHGLQVAGALRSRCGIGSPGPQSTHRFGSVQLPGTRCGWRNSKTRRVSPCTPVQLRERTIEKTIPKCDDRRIASFPRIATKRRRTVPSRDLRHSRFRMSCVGSVFAWIRTSLRLLQAFPEKTAYSYQRTRQNVEGEGSWLFFLVSTMKHLNVISPEPFYGRNGSRTGSR